MIKWKCENCSNTFESANEEDFESETECHIADCLRRDEFIIRLSD